MDKKLIVLNVPVDANLDKLLVQFTSTLASTRFFRPPVKPLKIEILDVELPGSDQTEPHCLLSFRNTADRDDAVKRLNGVGCQGKHLTARPFVERSKVASGSDWEEKRRADQRIRTYSPP